MNLIINTINTTHTMTSPNIVMNTAPPALTTSTIVTTSMMATNSKMVNNITLITPFIKESVIVANNQEKKGKGHKCPKS